MNVDWFDWVRLLVAWGGALGVCLAAITSIARRSVHPLVVAAQACAPIVIPIGWFWLAGASFAETPMAGIVAFGMATWWYHDLRDIRRPTLVLDCVLPVAPSLRVVSANLLISNDDTEHCAAALAALDAGVLATLETSDRHILALSDALRDRYGAAQATGTGPLGALAALWVRDDIPIRFTGRRRVGADELPEVVVDVAGNAVHIIGVHLQPPMTPAALKVWESELGELRNLVEGLTAAGAHVVLAGDFNAAYTHRGFRRLLDVATDAPTGTGYLLNRTWPVRLGMAWLMGIDHLLVSAGISCLRGEKHQIPGSDHLALGVDLRVADPPGVTRVADTGVVQ
jgi:endonuclease/exonuclease/phosphatase (EEP) superfamily protein YafD